MKDILKISIGLTVAGLTGYLFSKLIATRDPELSAMEELEPEDTLEEKAIGHSHH